MRPFILLAAAAVTAACNTVATPADSVTSSNLEQIRRPSEVPGEDFASFDRRIACIQHQREKRFGQAFDRGFHLKVHGCLRGQMTVNAALPAAYRVGVFAAGAAPRTVWVRLSNINQVDDAQRDLRGLALKVLGVDGAKILPGDPLDGQDFLMNDINVHFLNSPTQVVRSSEITTGAWIPLVAKTDRAPRRVTLADLLSDPALPRDYDFADPTDALIINRIRTAGQAQLSAPRTLLHREYHSRAQFALGGDYALRYFTRPCAPIADASAGAARAADPLQADLVARARQGICLKLMGQVRDAPIGAQAAWLDEHTQSWPEAEYPPLELAELRFRSQDILDQGQMDDCRALRFNPFHSLAEHQPLGLMNHGRYHIYKASVASPEHLRHDVKALRCDEIFPD